ncbi:hypothetical protein [Pelagovum pacificum]|uniref:DUF995 domain-containing protein n=1 Tax=Pelagovum pacificum TaxID=2588711 RepID=A0A5C5GJV7_9RHOB|nr:hypothetical protein [Pelagovum pacificum]QQA42748.1 hypothetical protein I8N54_18565 [Pelagovum pacificum]TNY34101.1 hypothetical protein FHY64_12815 [Pelagovum pacificum]
MAIRFLTTATTALLGAAPALAQTTCLEREKMVTILGENYEEQLVGTGLHGNDSIFEIFRTEDGQTWTILKTYPNGWSCVMAAGSTWLDLGERAFTPAEVES